MAVEARVVGDAGAYNYTSTKVLANANLMATGPYVVPNVHIDSYAVLTNNIPTGAFRGFGAPQAAFAAEGMMNKLADALSIDPVELRMRNIIREGSILSVGTPLPPGCEYAAGGRGVRARKFLAAYDRRLAQTHALRCPRYARRPTLGRTGWGHRCSVWRRAAARCWLRVRLQERWLSFGFPEQSWATVELHGGAQIEHVIVRHAGAEVGQGTHTIMQQMAAEAVGVPMERCG
ncbi:MAG: molybdopterin-dependent oxidoreductase [Blastochloris sp.]|nr:molybdopterin-dependent oxidoreductase [Blastochloris sp.]